MSKSPGAGRQFRRLSFARRNLRTFGAGAALLSHLFLLGTRTIMFYLCTCRGFTNLRRSMYSLCAVLCLSGVLVSAYGIYAAALNAREFSFFDRAIVTTIAIMAVVQIGASVAGAIGTERAPVYHSRRGRNLWLFLFAIGVFGCFWVQVKLILFTEAEYLNRDQRVCNAIDAENFRKVISDPDAWVTVENRDHCAGLYRNGTIAWLGPHNFARVFKYATDAQLDNCLVDFPPSAFNSSLFRPDFVAAYARAAAAHADPSAILDAIPRGCKEVQPFFVNLILLNIVQIVTAIVMVLALVTAMTLSMCKFQGHTVEGFLTEDEDPNSSSQYIMLS